MDHVKDRSADHQQGHQDYIPLWRLLLFFLRLGRERLGVAAAATARLTQIEFNELGTQGLNLLLHFGAYVVGPDLRAQATPAPSTTAR
jgi:hypothetical protein